MNHLRVGKSTPLQRLRVQRTTRKVIRAQRRVGLCADPIEIVVRGSLRPQMFACRLCRTAYSTNQLLGPEADRIAYAREQATRCCDARCRTCHEPVQRYHSSCDACSRKRRVLERKAWAVRARPVPYDGGWIYSEHVSGYNEGYFDSLDALVEYIADNAGEGLTLPAWVHPCREIYPSLDISDAYESMDENFGVEDVSPSADIPSDLAAELDAVVARINAGLKSMAAYQAQFGKVIILDAEAFNREFGVDGSQRPVTSWRDREPTVDPVLAAKYYRTIAEALSEVVLERESAAP